MALLAVAFGVAVLAALSGGADAQEDRYQQCLADSDCPTNYFCFEKFGHRICERCLDCPDRFNRRPSDRTGCSHDWVDCGPCLTGFRAEELAGGLERDKCQPVPDDEMEGGGVMVDEDGEVWFSEEAANRPLYVAVGVMAAVLALAVAAAVLFLLVRRWRKAGSSATRDGQGSDEDAEQERLTPPGEDIRYNRASDSVAVGGVPPPPSYEASQRLASPTAPPHDLMEVVIRGQASYDGPSAPRCISVSHSEGKSRDSDAEPFNVRRYNERLLGRPPPSEEEDDDYDDGPGGSEPPSPPESPFPFGHLELIFDGELELELEVNRPVSAPPSPSPFPPPVAFLPAGVVPQAEEGDVRPASPAESVASTATQPSDWQPGTGAPRAFQPDLEEIGEDEEEEEEEDLNPAGAEEREESPEGDDGQAAGPDDDAESPPSSPGNRRHSRMTDDSGFLASNADGTAGSTASNSRAASLASMLGHGDSALQTEDDDDEDDHYQRTVRSLGEAAAGGGVGGVRRSFSNLDLNSRKRKAGGGGGGEARATKRAH